MKQTPRIARLSLVLVSLAATPAFSADAANEPKPDLKPPCRGLMTRMGSAPAALSFIDNRVIHVNWADLEPQDQQFNGPGWQQIEQARKAGGRIRLRIMAGVHAPRFVKKLGHEPISDPELDLALKLGVNFVELPGGIQRFDVERLRDYDRRLEETPLDANRPAPTKTP